jgi:hypothetical protein
MRLIDADEMLDNESIAYIKAQSSKTISAMTRDVNKAVHAKIQMLIADTPTVEAKLVVHGEWIKGDSGEWQCSVCGEENCYAYCEPLKRFTDLFCPNCGADMRKKVER